ncbi:MAG: FixH family protein [Gemmatimonadaceae bacterium]
MRSLIMALPLNILASCTMFMRVPPETAFARTRVSESGRYRATIKPDGDSIPRGKLQSWTLHVETTDGAPVDSVAITIGGGMPQHGHGLPTKPQVTRYLGHGDYLVEGMKFNMGGWWVVKFRVGTASGQDEVVFNLKV